VAAARGAAARAVAELAAVVRAVAGWAEAEMAAAVGEAECPACPWDCSVEAARAEVPTAREEGVQVVASRVAGATEAVGSRAAASAAE
jgi:anaerobic selenocysteine-containing dehydrogenase